jgi:hypothetical protein
MAAGYSHVVYTTVNTRREPNSGESYYSPNRDRQPAIDYDKYQTALRYICSIYSSVNTRLRRVSAILYIVLRSGPNLAVIPDGMAVEGSSINLCILVVFSHKYQTAAGLQGFVYRIAPAKSGVVVQPRGEKALEYL